ncbi:transglycosylase SLT domain-containing protein [Pseudomonas fluorescens]|jgi:soluble lytic murein transglycosylase-like protein|uniref:transglycosylase SLT domain-containing protein n=1 Tax=Pseudomonas fluorescens TaxID=294 RepID=UPI0010E77DEF|nr:transglycosylase SLT domain-containing protein [Pseudomonas fluorescens]TCV62868.1 transglycosylase-like protein with SLT domain [Pseudomonas fluorescens]
MEWFNKTLITAVLTGIVCQHAAAFSLKGTVWEQEANRQCKVDPKLLYAFAIVESKKYAKDMVTPNPYALNISEKPYHPASKTEAATLLTNALTKTRSVAVGAMQVSLRWNGHRVADPSELLDLRTNVRVGTEILCEFLKNAQGDLPLVLGRYHTPNKDLETVARDYGRSVIAVWRNLIVLEQEGAK